MSKITAEHLGRSAIVSGVNTDWSSVVACSVGATFK